VTDEESCGWSGGDVGGGGAIGRHMQQ